MEKNIFIFDKKRCVGCQACVLACVNENGRQSAGQWKKVYSSNPSHFPHLPLFYLSLSCNHCDEAPCLYSCPTRAYSRDEESGAVLHHPEKCIGCKICTWACPYDAPVYNPQAGIIEKCTFCQPRLEQGLKPACAKQCPVGALDYSRQEFDAGQALESSPVPVKIGSSLKVEELEKKEGPRMDFSLFTDNPIPDEEFPQSSSRITAASEWPLLVFSLLNALLVGFYAYGVLRTTSALENSLILAGGLLSAVFSLSHLGKKSRAWRSLANLRHSWLSREILFLLLFYLSVFIDLLLIPLPKIFPLALGALLLISIDSLYSLAFWKWKIKIHSSQTLLLALSLYFLLQDFLTIFIVLSILRMGLYIIRNSKPGELSRAHIMLKSFRVLALTAAILVLYFTGNVWISTLCFLVGEVVDRIEFYNELNVPEPGSILATSSHRVT